MSGPRIAGSIGCLVGGALAHAGSEVQFLAATGLSGPSTFTVCVFRILREWT